MNVSADGADHEWGLIEEVVHRLFNQLAGREEHIAIETHLDELGWSDIEAEYPIAGCELLFRAQGRSLAATNCLERVMLAELGSVAEGANGLILPPLDHSAPAPTETGRIDGIVLGAPRGRLAVAVHDAGSVGVATVNADDLDVRNLGTFDPSIHWCSVSSAPPSSVIEASAQWTSAVAAAHRALATELIAITDEVLRKAIEHVGVRTQFGAQIGSFQSPRHALADVSVQLEGARALLGESWRFGGVLSAQAAKSAAGQAHRSVSAAALQVCGAIGLTSEHELHRYVRRGFQIDVLCGSYATLEARFAEQLFDPGAPPALPSIVNCG